MLLQIDLQAGFTTSGRLSAATNTARREDNVAVISNG